MSSTFASAFAVRAAAIRRRRALGATLGGATAGLVAGAAFALAAWRTSHEPLRAWGALGAPLGAVAVAAVAARRRWSDVDVALYLDAKLGSGEAIATAVTLGEGAPAMGDAVRERARQALARADEVPVGPRAARPWHAVSVAGAAAIAAIALAPPMPRAMASAPPGTTTVTLADVRGLERIEALRGAPARDEADRQRLDRIAEDARKLAKRLRQGVERREAQSELARLRDAIVGERWMARTGGERRGLEAAVGKLGQSAATKGLAAALADQDAARLDAEVEKLANAREEHDRAEAREALAAAENAARAAGAEAVARALGQSRERLERGAAGRAADGRTGRSPSDEAERRRALDEAEREAAGAEKGLAPDGDRATARGDAGVDGAANGAGDGDAGTGERQHGPGATAEGEGAARSGTDDRGRGAHAGRTDAIAGSTMASRARPELRKGAAASGAIGIGRAPGRAGETANVRGEGALGVVGPAEIGGVERSEVPEDYRQQVGRYFQP